MYVFLTMLGLCCCVGLMSCSRQGLLYIVVPGLLLAVASLVAMHGLWGMQASVVVAPGLF